MRGSLGEPGGTNPRKMKLDLLAKIIGVRFIATSRCGSHGCDGRTWKTLELASLVLDDQLVTQ